MHVPSLHLTIFISKSRMLTRQDAFILDTWVGKGLLRAKRKKIAFRGEASLPPAEPSQGQCKSLQVMAAVTLQRDVMWPHVSRLHCEMSVLFHSPIWELSFETNGSSQMQKSYKARECRHLGVVCSPPKNTSEHTWGTKTELGKC